MTPEEAYAEEVKLERAMTLEGVKRFSDNLERRQREGKGSTLPSVKGMLYDATLKTVVVLRDLMYKTNQKDYVGNYIKTVVGNGIKLEELAFMTLRVMFDNVRSGAPLIKLSNMVADELDAHVNFYDHVLRTAATKASSITLSPEQKVLLKRNQSVIDGIVKDIQSPPRRRLAITNYLRSAGIDLDVGVDTMRGHVSLGLIEAAINATGLFTWDSFKDLEKQANRVGARFVYLSPAALDQINACVDARQSLLPVYKPMLCPPKKWTSFRNGGYLTDAVHQPVLMRMANREQQHMLEHGDHSKMFEAVNAVQATPWHINANVLYVLRRLWLSSKDEIALDRLRQQVGLPVRVLPKKPEIPAKLKAMRGSKTPWEEYTPEDRIMSKTWTLTKKAYNETRATTISKQYECSKAIEVADFFKGYERIFFPHTFDFRGRVYPIPVYLQPQQGDISRGLLEFADAVPIGNFDGEKWLASHGASMWGIDKCSFQKRWEWIRDNRDKILAVADDPFTNTFWAEAEKPWQALAFCYDWKGYVNERYEYKSRLPVGMDGTCNGLQHFSAMLRDEIGGRAVNLLPADKPSDIYQEVANVVAPVVERDATTPGPNQAIALGWQGHVTRKVCKRPVMTFCYGATLRGFTNQLDEDIIAHWPEVFHGEPLPWTPVQSQSAAVYMAKLLWENVGKVVVKASEAMKWIQYVTRTMSKHGLPVVWQTPIGFPVVQRYQKDPEDSIKIKMVVGTETIYNNQSKSIRADAPLDKFGQATAISPNFVHSMDGAHLLLTVRKASFHGIKHFYLVHDNYGTHAGRCDELARILRTEFVKMYEKHDVLQEFMESQLKQLEETGVKNLALIRFEFQKRKPKPGKLELWKVMRSKYFFA